MPIYSFRCPKCKQGFEVFKSRSQAGEPEQCVQCSSIAERDWLTDNVYMKDQPKTVGSIADKNSAKLSNDQKEEIISRNRRKPTKNPYVPKENKIEGLQ